MLQSTHAIAQKSERELGIDIAEVPTVIVAWLDSAYVDRRRLNYYKDVSEESTTIEAKFKHADVWHSIEFTPAGQWLDTEFDVPIREITDAVWSQVCSSWTERFEKFRVARVQHHFGRGGEEFYEVELRAREDFEWGSYEVAIDPDGAVLQEKVIELAPGHLDRW